MTLAHNWKRRKFLCRGGQSLIALSTAPLISCRTERKSMKSKPNILFITTDYQRGVDLPSYGSPFLTMPNLNKLCEKGAVFTNHISTSPICMPARTCWMTGQYPHTHGMWDNANKDWHRTGPTLMQLLREQGYYNLSVGKMHLRPEKEYNRPEGFHRRITCESRDGSPPDDNYELFLKESGWTRQKIKEFQGKYQIRPGNAVFDWPIDENLYFDNYIADQALNLINKDELDRKPWFFWLSFCGPHNPWTAPRRYTEPYREMKNLPLGAAREGELMDKPIDYTRHRYCYGESMWEVYDYLNSGEQADLRRRVRAGHYGTLTLIDERIGDVLQALEQKGQLENTIIVFSSDHGSSLFDNGLLHKGTHFDESVRVPFIICYPGHIKPGFRHHFSTHVDLLPTLVKLAGAKIPEGVEGKDLTPMLNDPGARVQDFAVMECTLTTSIITHDWRMSMHHFNGDSDLYDIKEDPHSFFNLSGKPEYADVEKKLRDALVQWRREFSPEMDIPDNPFAWRECLGPQDFIQDFRQGYIKQYKRLARLDPTERPGKVGKYMQDFLDRAYLM